ncbi:hypothetical protein KHS38_06885 [Mucilaginibacter sp. Bleaf8]|uniref:hypothetical protein n=1 Tax=Mucilaginibacter sp. Bleaf8 TaxID=2834430 RepID=UPI001BCB81C7|nr:hypothetical protein [Mucilaginibacter sp. Bleaf8]MBS7564126.1 hypothetical protein [Mucilaginibacter sp. Bleaf8]
MFDLKFHIEQVLGHNPVTPEELTEHIIYVVKECNYHVCKHAPGVVTFEPYGPMPVSREEGPYYMSKSWFELIEVENENVLRLTFGISYLGEIWLACIMVLGIITVDYKAAFFLIIIFFSFYRRYKRIKHDAEKMLNYLVEVSS